MDTTTGVGPVVAAADLRAALRQRWWVLVICTLLGLAAAAIAVKVMPRTYSATTSIYVTETGEERADRVGNNNGNTSGGKDKVVNMDTEAKIVSSAAVADRARTVLKTSTPATDLVDQITIAVTPNTTVLDITAETGTPTDAQRLSRAFARGYLDQRAETAKATIAAQVKIYDARIADVTKQLQTVTGQVAALPANSPDRAFADARQKILVDQVTSLSNQLSNLHAITVSPGRVLSEAPLPTKPQQPPGWLMLAAGALFGLLCGLGLAMLLAKLDRRIRRAADLQALGDVPLLGTIPPGRSAGAGAALPGVAPSASPIGQAFGQIRNDVTTALPMRPATLLVAGTEPGTGNSLVAANLAVALARSGTPVLLVCADFAGSSAERMLGLEGLSRADGLAEALAGQGEPVTLLRAAPVVPGLWVMGAGRGRDSAAELLQSRQLEWVLSTVRGESFVILEAPPTSSGADAQAMARLCDAALLVTEVGRSRLDAIDDGAHQLARVGTPLLGVVVTQRQSAAKRRRPAPPPPPVERQTLGEATVAIRADQLKTLRARAKASGGAKEIGGDKPALEGGDSPSREGDAHAGAGIGRPDRSGEGALDDLSPESSSPPSADVPRQGRLDDPPAGFDDLTRTTRFDDAVRRAQIAVDVEAGFARSLSSWRSGVTVAEAPTIAEFADTPSTDADDPPHDAEIIEAIMADTGYRSYGFVRAVQDDARGDEDLDDDVDDEALDDEDLDDDKADRDFDDPETGVESDGDEDDAVESDDGDEDDDSDDRRRARDQAETRR